MKTFDIPVRMTDVDEQTVKTAINEVWKKDAVRTKEYVDKNVLSASFDVKTAIIVFLLLVGTVFAGGYFSKDSSIQDSLERIEKEKKNVSVQTSMIKKANDSISGSLANIEKEKEFLATRKIVVQ